MPRRIATASIVLVGLVLHLAATTGRASIINGGFETPGIPPDAFAGWETFEGGQTFDRPTAGSDAAGRFAIFTDTGPLGSSQLEQTYSLPADAIRLSFDYLMQTDGTPLPGSIPDGFQATQFDVGFNPILPTGPLQPAYYSIDNKGTELSNPAVSLVNSAPDLRPGWTRVVLDVTSVSAQPLLLEFLLSKSFVEDGVTTTVSLDNVVLTTGPMIPEPRSLAVWAFLGLAAAIVVCRRSPHV